jgi:copper transport protein
LSFTRTGAVLFASVLALLALPGGVVAHEELRDADPAHGDTLSVVPEQIRLTFVNPIQLALAHVTLVGPQGAVELGELQRASDAAHVLLAPVRGKLVAGAYTVRWQVAGPDGHPVRGDYSFTIRRDAEGLAPPPRRSGDTAQGASSFSAAPDGEAVGAGNAAVPLSEFDSESLPYVAVRWLTFVGMLGVIGVVVFRLLVLALLERGGSLPNTRSLHTEASSRALRVAFGSVAVLAVASILRLLAQLYALHGPSDLLDAGRVGSLLGGTTWGLGWLLQTVAILVATLGFALAGSRTRAGWALAAVGAVVLSFTPALSGHAAGVQELGGLAVLADGLHVLGAGGWLGGLLVVVVAGLPAALRQPSGGRAAAAALINAFSPTALTFAGVVVATGVVSAWLHVGALSALWTTSYGRTLLLKLGIVSLVFGTGAYNWLKVRPALGHGPAAGRLRRSATLELAVALAVLAVTAVLVATPLPTDP